MNLPATVQLDTPFHLWPERDRVSLLRRAIYYARPGRHDCRSRPALVYAWMAGYTGDPRFVRLEADANLTAGAIIL